MQVYVIGRVGDNYLQPFHAYVGALSVIQIETVDSRKARRIIRLSRRLGYSDVKFWKVITVSGKAGSKLTYSR